MENSIKSVLRDGGSRRHLNTFANLFIVAVCYTHASTHAIIIDLYTMLLAAPI